jgi:hypothetical protein
MPCFEVWINGEKEQIVGFKSAEEYGVYLSAYPDVSSDSVSLEMSGYAPNDRTYPPYPDELRWGSSELHPDDEVVIRVVRAEAPDSPTRTRYAEGQIDEPPNVMICSNCGRSHLDVEQMITAQRITLCGECCRKFAEFISDETMPDLQGEHGLNAGIKTKE